MDPRLVPDLAVRRLHPKLLQLEPKDVAKLCSAYSHLGFQHHTVFKEAVKESRPGRLPSTVVGCPQVVSCLSWIVTVNWYI